ncbi:hypothetical protein LOTGIDRAFT_176897, partial [Lottia gigantea]
MKLFSFLIGILIILGLIFSLLYDSLNPDKEYDSDDNTPPYQFDPDKTGHSLNDKLENLFWFVQISDLHISKYKDLKRGPDLVHLCKTHLSVIKPEIVITS